MHVEKISELLALEVSFFEHKKRTQCARVLQSYILHSNAIHKVRPLQYVLSNVLHDGQLMCKMQSMITMAQIQYCITHLSFFLISEVFLHVCEVFLHD